jgi:hypothetical protein
MLLLILFLGDGNVRTDVVYSADILDIHTVSIILQYGSLTVMWFHHFTIWEFDSNVIPASG